MFTTDRLTLRAWREGDDNNMLLLYNNPLVAPYITFDYIIPQTPKYKAELNELAANAIMFCIIEEKESNNYVGVVGFINKPNPKNQIGGFMLGLLPEFWRKGYGEEATRFMVDYGFHSLGLHRISMVVFEGNDRAMALYQRVGFKIEGTAKRCLWMDGRWHDVYYTAILEDEWAELKKSGITSNQ
ncbi:acyl-CoA N-acyltransferase [Crucibulum laeve]|uniref:Acyl-CoA N-acyltransferase n=1 Tax=Crucibulum laeve TaxID=68775 RepID=A0A5C3M7B2_9AGAR|nr:acyl-CoA N-acyltransferase [Crucibulum laeve]